MSERVPFSRRYNIDAPSDGLVYDSMPHEVVNGIVNVLDSLEPYWPGIVSRICLETDAPLPVGDGRKLPTMATAREILGALPWNRVCDACEGLYEYEQGQEREGYDPDEGPFTIYYHPSFQTRLNQVFARNYFGYEMRDGLIERVGAITHEEVIEEARAILADPDLAGPARQFVKAQEAFSKRPQPDLENAVKDGVGAVEGLVRKLLGDDTILLSNALPKLRRDKGIPTQLSDVLAKLYAYRGDADGAAHGSTSDAPEIRLEDAEFALSVSASAIVYLARLYGRGVQ